MSYDPESTMTHNTPPDHLDCQILLNQFRTIFYIGALPYSEVTVLLEYQLAYYLWEYTSGLSSHFQHIF